MRADSLHTASITPLPRSLRGASRKRAAIAVAAIAVLALAASVALDMTGLLAPLPTAERVLAHMRRSWDHLEGYQAFIGFGRWGTSHSPDGGSEQWFTPGAALIEINHDPYGFTRIERWGPDQWDLFQPGAGLEAHTTVDHLGRIPYGRWAISRVPALEDIVQAVSEGEKLRVIDRDAIDGAAAWVVEFNPRLRGPQGRFPTGMLRRNEQFYQVIGRRWRVWMSDSSGLPMRAKIGRDGDPEPPVAMDVEDFKPGKPVVPAVWREIFKGDTKVKQTLDLRCDALAPATVAAARGRIDAIRIAWQSMIMQHIQNGGTPKPPGPGTDSRNGAGGPGSPRQR